MSRKSVHRGTSPLRPCLALAFAVSACMLSTLSCSAPPVSEQALADYALARGAYDRGDLQSAESALRGTLRGSPRFHQAEFLLGKVVYFSGGTAEAERIFRGLIRRHGSYNDAEIWLVRTLVEGGRSDEAERRLEELLARDGGDPRLLHLMGTIRRDRGDLASALAFFERAAAFGEELARSEFERARIHHVYGQSATALREVERSLALLPETSPLRPPIAALRDAIAGGRSP